MANYSKEEVQKLQDEMDEFQKNFRKGIKENTVASDWPEMKRSYSYRKSPAIKSHDLEL